MKCRKLVFDIRGYFEISVSEISRADCASSLRPIHFMFPRKLEEQKNSTYWHLVCLFLPGHVAHLIGHLTCKSEVLGLIPSLATYFHFSFR